MPKINTNDRIYITKYDRNENFKKHILVKLITITDSGKCYLVESLDNEERHWIMYYDLYLLNSHKYHYNHNFYKEEDLEKIGLELLKEYQ